MKNFLIKEIRLCMVPLNWLFLLFLGMLLIPSYPCYVPFFYICLSIFFMFNFGEINKDMQYSLILPIKKRDIVKSRCIIIAAYQILSMLLSIPLALLIAKINPAGNLAGIDCNVAFYGLEMIMLTVFNFTFLTKFYKKGEKPGVPFFIAAIIYFVVYVIVEFPIWAQNALNVPYFKIMDSVQPEDLVKQLPVFGAGLLIYILGWILTYKVSAKRFEKVNL